MNAAFLVLTTAPSVKAAKSMAAALVRRKLCACATVQGGAVSFYFWKKRLRSSREALILIKTVKRRFKALEKYLKSMHPYELPEIIALPIAAGSKEYLQWLESSL